MACRNTCGPRCGSCHDHGSTAEQLPSLGAIDVVDGIFRKAATNYARRMVALNTGELSPEEFKSANEKLVTWMGVTFSGGNAYYEKLDYWHPEGLVQAIEKQLGEELPVARSDEEVIGEATRVWLQIVGALMENGLSFGMTPEQVVAESNVASVIGQWANLFAGALFDEEA